MLITDRTLETGWNTGENMDMSKLDRSLRVAWDTTTNSNMIIKHRHDNHCSTEWSNE